VRSENTSSSEKPQSEAAGVERFGYENAVLLKERRMIICLEAAGIEAERNTEVILFKVVLLQVKGLLRERRGAEKNQQGTQEGVFQLFGFRPL
jgi:hypothetical protein